MIENNFESAIFCFFGLLFFKKNRNHSHELVYNLDKMGPN